MRARKRSCAAASSPMSETTNWGLHRLKASIAWSRSSVTRRVISGVSSHSHSRPRSSGPRRLARGSSTMPSARWTPMRRSNSAGSMQPSLPHTTWMRATPPPAAAASSAASRTRGAHWAAWEVGRTTTLTVLQTLRSRLWRTTARRREGSAEVSATIHAPPVPWAETGTPAWRATAESCWTARPEPRVTASARRESEKSAHPAQRSRTGTTASAPSGRPASRRAGTIARSRMAWAVPSASPPMRRTAVLPEARTPAASARTLGRPSKTKAMTPRGAVSVSTLHVSWSMTSRRRESASLPSSSRRWAHPRSPWAISSRTRSLTASRVVERPRSRAALTSSSLATWTAPQACSRWSAKARKKEAMEAGVRVRMTWKASTAASTWLRTASRTRAGTCRSAPVSWTT